MKQWHRFRISICRVLFDGELAGRGNVFGGTVDFVTKDPGVDWIGFTMILFFGWRAVSLFVLPESELRG